MPPVATQTLDNIYRAHHSWLRGWLHHRLGCSETASDLAQDAFMRLLAKEKTAQIQEPRAFLTTVAKRVLSNHWRRQQVERAYLEALASQSEPLVISPEERALVIETLMEIDSLLDGLPQEVRRAFLYAQLDGLKQADIAARMNISISTVKRHLRRAAMQCYFAMRDQ